MRVVIRLFLLLGLFLTGCSGFADSMSGSRGLAAGNYRGTIESGGIPRPEDFSLAAFISQHTYQFPPSNTDTPVTVHALASFVGEPAAKGPRAMLLLGLTAAKT